MTIGGSTRLTELAYDEVGRVTRVRRLDGAMLADDTVLTYTRAADGVRPGLLASASHTGGSIVLAYDGAARVTRVDEHVDGERGRLSVTAAYTDDSDHRSRRLAIEGVSGSVDLEQSVELDSFGEVVESRSPAGAVRVSSRTLTLVHGDDHVGRDDCR